MFPITSVETDWLTGVPLGEGGGGGADFSDGKCIKDGLAILKIRDRKDDIHFNFSICLQFYYIIYTRWWKPQQ